jgi:uncharacterized phage protein (TIGR02218 family)
MISASTTLKAHLAAEVTTLALCWKVVRKDGVTSGFTSFSRDLVVDGITYKASTGFTPTAIETSAGLAVDQLEVEAILNDTSITEADLQAGKYDYAAIEVFLVNYQDLTQGKLVLRVGTLGEVTVRKGVFVAEIRGLSQAFQRQIGELYSPTCRVKRLGDTRCKIDLAPYTHTLTVSAVTDQRTFAHANSLKPDGYFQMGLVEWLTGANAGLEIEVKTYASGVFTLVQPMPYTIAAGNTFKAIRGCDRTFETCRTVFNNVLNFRGEPHLPGIDQILKLP